MLNEKRKIPLVLVVEDEEEIRQALADALDVEGYKVIQAVDGEAGLATATKEQPDLIILDILMPKMDGMEMMKQLREKGGWAKEVPIILLTNLSASEKIIRGIAEDTPSYFLVKSDWTIRDVLGKVKECLKR